MSNIFLSYRRSDSADAAGRIYDRLVADFTREAVFKDVDSIPLSVPFPDYLREALTEAKAVIVIIGPTYATASDDTGAPRLQDPADFVRIEVETALRLGVPTIPVTVSNAVMPDPRDLPPELSELCARNGQSVRPDPDFHRDMNRLVSRLRMLSGMPRDTDRKALPVDTSLAELEQILQQRARNVEQWFANQMQGEDGYLGNARQSGDAVRAFRRLHKEHIHALRNRRFVLAHETLREIHELLGRYDSTMYDQAPEYGYEYPGSLDSDDMYLLLKNADPTVKTQLVKSLFVGMISSEYPRMHGTSSFQFSFLNTGICLVRAVSEQDLAMVQALLDAGFHVDIRVTSKREEPRGENSTPLMFAASSGNREIVEELLQKGADVNAENGDGQTAAQIAEGAGHDDIARLLRERTASDRRKSDDMA